MMIRMFEYDSQIALDDGNVVSNKLIVTFPHSGVLYLRHTRNTPDAMIIEINTPGGNICYEIPVMKTQMYTLDDIFDKNLLFLIPFYIFSFESRLKEYDEDEEALSELKTDYSEIRNRLDSLCMEGKITEYVKCTIIEMSKRVIDSIAIHYANVRKGVTSVMGGKILEHEAKTILQHGISEGRREGMIEGYINLVKDGLLSISEAAKRLDMKEEEFKKYL